MNHWLTSTSAAIPLLFMLIVGGGWWAFDTFVFADRPAPPGAATIVVEPEEWRVAVEDFEASIGREASAEERKLVLQRIVDDELLLAEGLRTNPWNWDPVVRRRLVQLVRFFDDIDDIDAPENGPAEQAPAGHAAQPPAAVRALLERASRYDIRVEGRPLDLEQEWTESRR